MIKIQEKRTKNIENCPIVNRMDCKNYRNCLTDFALRAFKSDVKNTAKNQKFCESCVGCDRYEGKN